MWKISFCLIESNIFERVTFSKANIRGYDREYRLKRYFAVIALDKRGCIQKERVKLNLSLTKSTIFLFQALQNNSCKHDTFSQGFLLAEKTKDPQSH